LGWGTPRQAAAVRGITGVAALVGFGARASGRAALAAGHSLERRERTMWRLGFGIGEKKI